MGAGHILESVVLAARAYGTASNDGNGKSGLAYSLPILYVVIMRTERWFLLPPNEKMPQTKEKASRHLFCPVWNENYPFDKVTFQIP
jgi:hypothetical protein